MEQTDKKIVWIEHISRKSGRSYFYGYYEGKKIFYISEELNLSLTGLGFFVDGLINYYETISSAKRGAARFLKRLQEAVK